MSKLGEPSDAQIYRAAIRARLADVRTAAPGIVVSYDATKQTVTVKLATRIQAPYGRTEELPPLEDVPVKWQRGGGYFCTMPLVAGNAGLLVFCEEDFTHWRETGEVADPDTTRKHGLNAYFLPGAGIDGEEIGDAAADCLVIGKDGGNVIRIKNGAIELGRSASDFVALASKVNANFQAIVDLFSSWTPAPNDGGAALKALTGSLTFDDTDASKVKAE